MSNNPLGCNLSAKMKGKPAILILLLFVALTQLVSGQTKYIKYYDEEWKEVKSKNDASYYRVLEYDVNSVLQTPVKDYYITGELQSEGIPLGFDNDGNIATWKGVYTAFHKNGNKQSMYPYNDIGMLSGVAKTWYEDGTLRSEETYKNDTLNGLYKSYFPSGKLFSEVFFENGLVKGNWYKECDEFGVCKRVIHDNLNSPQNPLGWDRSSGKDHSYRIDENLGLLCELKSAESHTNLIYLPIDQNGDFSIEISFYLADLEENASQGLVWGMKDWENYHYFAISTTQQFYIGSVYDGLKIKTKDWENTTSVRTREKEVNTIKVSRYGEKVYFSINGDIVHSESFSGFRGNNVGYSLSGAPTSEIGIGGFKVTESLDANAEMQGNNIKSSGSCFLIDPAGFAVTNYHVVDQAKEISVQFIMNEQKVEYPGEVVVVDKSNDLALIKVKGENFPMPGSLKYNFVTDIMDVGTDVFTLGFPAPFGTLGEEVKFTDGKISAKTGYDNDVRTYQITVPVQPGNSGGPLYDYDGNLVGVINAKYTQGDNVSYALKSNLVKNLIDVVPKKITLPNDTSLANRSLREKIKIYSGYVGLVIVR